MHRQALFVIRHQHQPSTDALYLHTIYFLQWHPGTNVGQGKDYTLFSTVDGIVIYSKKKDRSFVSTIKQPTVLAAAVQL